MFPTLFQIGPLTISSLGVFLALAFLVGLFFIWQKGREENFDLLPLVDAAFLASMTAFVFSRIFFVFFNPSGSLAMFFNFFKYPGFSYFGALFGGFSVFVYYAAKFKWDFFRLADVLVFGLLPAHILVRVGNFLDGSYYGKVTNLPWGIRFPGLEQAVHPLSLYEIFILFGLYLAIIKLERQYRLFDWYRNKRGEASPGFLFLTYLLSYALARLLLEFIKESTLYWYGLSWEQWFSIWLVLASLILFYKRSGRNFGELVTYIQKKLHQAWGKDREKKLDVIVPIVKPKRRLRQSQRDHFKTGMEAKRND